MIKDKKYSWNRLIGKMFWLWNFGLHCQERGADFQRIISQDHYFLKADAH